MAGSRIKYRQKEMIKKLESLEKKLEEYDISLNQFIEHYQPIGLSRISQCLAEHTPEIEEIGVDGLNEIDGIEEDVDLDELDEIDTEEINIEELEEEIDINELEEEIDLDELEEFEFDDMELGSGEFEHDLDDGIDIGEEIQEIDIPELEIR